MSSENRITVDQEVPAGVTADTPVTDVKTSARKRARKDSAPKRKAAKRPAQPEITTDAIRQALTQILTLPAVPCAMAQDEWAANHFAVQGPQLADAIAEQSERHPVLRRWCERLVGGEALAVLFMATMMYALPPMIHWGIVPAPEEAKAFLGVPTEVPPETDTAAQAMDGNSSNTSNRTGAGDGIA